MDREVVNSFNIDSESSAGDYMSALEGGRSQSLASTSSQFDKYQEDTEATSTMKVGQQNPLDHHPSTHPSVLSSPEPDQDTERHRNPPNTSTSSPSKSMPAASLFSVPPQDAPHSGIYDMPLEAFEFRDLDSGRTFYLDKRYWIKDVDTGKVYVLEPDDEEEPKRGTPLKTPSTVTSAAALPPQASSSMRVSDLISGENLTLEEFEQTLGYFREAPPLISSPSLSHHLVDPAVRRTSSDFAAQAQHLAQKSLQSLSLAAQASATWIKEKAMSAKDLLTSPSGGGGRGGHLSGNDGGAVFWRDSASSPTSSLHGAKHNFDGQGLGVRVNCSRKPYKELTDLRLVQSVEAHQGVIWTMKFCKSGRYLATAGQDCVISVWEVILHREKESASSSTPNSPPGTAKSGSSAASTKYDHSSTTTTAIYGVPVLKSQKPFRLYRGHKQDILDVAWSKTNFLLSASMDKTVRLWHVSMDECLRVFKHTDFVTAIDFHPSDDKLFVSGSIDGKVRLWNVPEQRVVSWQDVHDMVTAVGYSRDGRRAVVGTMRGKCRFYGVTGRGTLEYEAQLDVKNKRGQHARGKKVTGLYFAPTDTSSVLITSNDSRVRLYDGYTLRSKYKGHSNKSTQIKAAFSPKGDYVICGSDDGFVYIWSTRKNSGPPGAENNHTRMSHNNNALKSALNSMHLSSPQSTMDTNDASSTIAKEKNASYESFQVANDVITVALFGPECTHRPLDDPGPSTATLVSSQNFAAGTAEQEEGEEKEGKDELERREKVELNGPQIGDERLIPPNNNKSSSRSNTLMRDGNTSTKSSSNSSSSLGARGQVILAAGYDGVIKIYENIGMPHWL